MNFVASNYLSLKYQKSPKSVSIDIEIRKFEFVAKTQFLYNVMSYMTFTWVNHKIPRGLKFLMILFFLRIVLIIFVIYRQI